MTDPTNKPAHAVARPSGLTKWEREIFDHIDSHVTSERELITEYAKWADDASDSYVRYLVDMIVTDETRHHQMLLELANSLRSAVEFLDHEPQAPRVSHVMDEHDLLELTNRFIAVEEHDARDLKRMRKHLRSARDVTLWPLLVELMEIDTDKHLRILRFIRDRAQTMSL